MKKTKSGSMSRRNFMILGCGALGGLRAIGMADPRQTKEPLSADQESELYARKIRQLLIA